MITAISKYKGFTTESETSGNTLYSTTLVSGPPCIFMSSFICGYHVCLGLQTQVSTVSKDHWLFTQVIVLSNCTVHAILCIEAFVWCM